MVAIMMLAAALAAQNPPGTHVRTMQWEIAAFIEAGRARSATFRRLIATLDSSDVIVHVEPKLTRPGLGGFLNYAVVAVGRYRYLRIAIDIRGPNSHVVPLLAHELQHAIEIADAPEARDAQGVEDVFRRLNGITGRGDSPYSLETEAAIDIERAVRREFLASSERATSGHRSSLEPS
jgi:hypothetical protein